ncbi:MAG: transcriptional repressor [Planctomycetaceae bacterium]|nr:transcriptional repressor [Planctomycetaceae bacterium]
MNKASTRLTKQRHVILDQLCAICTHPTADELYQLVRCQLPHISLGTVYRNLELLSDQGVIQRLELSGHQRRYDGNAADHCHIRCVHCDRVADVEGEYTLPPLQSLASATNYEIIGQRVELLGLCPDCKSSKPE